MLPTEQCSKHPGQNLISICISKGCEDRSLCSVCEASHIAWHEFVRWDIKLSLRNICDRFMEKKRQRLKYLMHSFREGLRASVEAMEESLSRQIKLSSESLFLQYSGNNQMLSHLVREFLASDYSDIDKERFKELQTVLQSIDDDKSLEQPVELSPMDEALLSELVRDLETRLNSLERIYWFKPPKPKSEIRSSGALKEKSGALVMELPTEEARKRYQELVAESQAEEARIAKLLDQKRKNAVLLEKAALGSSGQLSKLLSRLSNSSEVTSLTIANSGLTDLKPFELLEGRRFAQNLAMLDLSSNQICSVMELCLLELPQLQELKLAKNKVSDLRHFERRAWPSLRLLDLSSNSFRSLRPLQRFTMPALAELILDSNKVETLCPIGRSNFPSAVRISLNDVDIGDKVKLADIYFENENLRKKCCFVAL